MTARVGSGLLRAILDAVHGADEQLAGQAITRLRAPLLAADTDVLVEATPGFGEVDDGANNARIVVGGEVIDCGTRTGDSFGTLTRGQQSTTIQDVYPTGTVVYDIAQNSSALDLTRRGFLVNYALSTDLDVVGRNLGLDRCPGVPDDTWRIVIREVAYLAKQTLGAVQTALEALQGGSGFSLFERVGSSPNRFFVTVEVPLTDNLRGRFFLNGGEPQTVAAGGVITLDYDIAEQAFAGTQAAGAIRVVSGAFLVDGETFTLDDGLNPAVTFEFDDDASVVSSATLRPVAFTAGDSEQTIRDAIISAIAGAPALDINASVLDAQNVGLVNTAIGVAGNQTILETVADPIFAVTGMVGGADAGVSGAIFVVADTTAARQGVRDVNLFVTASGSVTGSNEITIGLAPGTDVLVDYNATPAHYLPPDENFENVGDFPPYFADNLLAARCLLDQVRAAGVGVELSVSTT
jgi:hypothetical protein